MKHILRFSVLGSALGGIAPALALFAAILSFADTASAATFTGRAAEKCDPNDPNEHVGSPNDWYEPKNWGTPCDPGTPPGPGQTAVIPAGFTVYAGGLSLGQLDLEGTLYVSGNCNIQQVNITGGGKLISNGDWRTLTVGTNFVMDGDQIAMHTFLPPGTSMRWKKGMQWGNLDQSGGALLFIQGAGDHVLNACDVTLNGVTTWSDAGRIVQVGFTDTTVNIINKGTFLASGSGSFFSSGYLRFNFINEAEFIKDGGTTGFSAENLARPMNFLNRGIVDVRSGILDFPVGMFSLENGCTVKGVGPVRVSGGLLHLPTGSTCTVTGVLELSAGRFEGNGTMTGEGGTFNWTGGSLGFTQGPYEEARPATLNIPPGMTMNISGDIDKRLGGDESTCSPCHRQHGVLNNAGTVNWTGGGDIFTSFGGGEIINSGLFAIHNDVPFRVFYDGGTLTNTSTGILRKVNGSGKTTFPAGFGLSNEGNVDVQKGIIEVTSHLRMLDGSAYSGAGKLVSTGTGNIVGINTISGNVELQAGRLRGGEGEAAPTGTLATEGTGKFRWIGGQLLGTVNIAANSQFLISGTEDKLMGYFQHNDLSSAGLTLNNAGTITWTGTGNIVDANTGIINNTGTFIARNSATLGFNQFHNHGTFRREQGGTTNVTEMTGGTFNHYGTINVTGGELTAKNPMVLHENSIFTGEGRFASEGGASLISSVLINGGTYEHRASLFRGGADGIIRTSGSGKFEWTGGNLTQTVSLESGGVMQITGATDKALGHYYGWQDNAPGTFNNRGTVTWTGTGGILDHNTGTLNNAGTFFVRTASPMQGRFRNTGVLDVGSPGGSVNFGGTSFTLAPEGTVEMEIAGTDNPIGRITTSPGAAMGGTLNLRFAKGFVPAIGDTFAVIPNGSGQFASVNSPPERYLMSTYAGGLSLVAQASPRTMADWLAWRLRDSEEPLPEPLDDLNHDGISLLEEYALGRNPLGPHQGPVFTHGYTRTNSTGTAVPKAVPVGGVDYLSFTYVRPGGDSALTDVDYIPQRSSTLNATGWLEDLVIQSVVFDPVTSMETVTVRSPIPYSPVSGEFIRLKITLTD